MLSLSKKALVVVIGVFALTQTCAIADSRRDVLRAIRDSELEEEYPMRLVMEGQDQPKYDDELEAWLEANDDDDDDDMADDDLDEGEDEDMGDDEHDLAMERDWGWLKNIGNHINRAVQRVSNHVHKAVQHVGNHIRTTIDRINNRHNPQPAPAPVPAPVPTPAPTTRAPTVAPTQAPTEPPVIEETTMPVVPEDVPSIGEDALPPQEETTTIGENALPPQEETPSIGENALPPQESGLLGERTFEMCPSHRIQLQASNGNLLARCEGCGSGSFANSITAPSALIADESAKTWRVRMLEDDRIALESEQGGYLGSLAEGAPYPWYVYSVGGNTVYLVSPHGKLLTRWGSDGTASMLHATTKTDAHVHWHVICMPAQEAVAGETAPEPETVAEPEPASEPRADMQMPIKAPMLQPTGGRLV